MNLEQYKAKNNLSTSDVIELVQQAFPKFTKHQFSMIKRGIYGVVLDPKAVKVLNEAHPAKHNRIKANKVTVMMNDFLYGLLLEKCERESRTRQDVIETAVYTSLKPEASTVQPHEFNSKLQKELNDCRNELCLKCGNYRESYLGACDGCRWKH